MKNVNDVLNDESFKYNGIYRAIVVSCDDPRDIGQVKVHVPAVFPDNLEVGKYPWAKPALGLYNSGGENVVEPKGESGSKENEIFNTTFNSLGTGGIFTVPNVGNTVFVWFDQGNFMYPYYFAMEAKEGDWLNQKNNIKSKINSKVDDITKFVEKFKPELGENGIYGEDWGNGAYINTRQRISSEGESIGNRKGDTKLGDEKIKAGNYVPTKINNSNKDKDGKDSINMSEVVDRARTNQPSLDIKPLYDKENGTVQRKIVDSNDDIDYDENPHVYPRTWGIDDVYDNDRNINKYVTSIMTQGGTTIVIDNRDGQENFYLIHKGYMQNIDQHGSVKEYVGTNKVENDVERCDKELGVEGDNKIHVLGNFITNVKGNKFTQVDKNLQIDVNDSCGIRMKKGDFDIILNGETDSERDDNKDSDRERGKDEQYGDLNIDIKNGNLDVRVKKNCNIHVEGNTNLKVDGDLKQTIGGNYHLKVDGDFIRNISGNEDITIGKDKNLKVGGSCKQEISSGLFISSNTDIEGTVKVNGIVNCDDVSSKSGVSLNGHKHIHQWYWSHAGGSGSKETTPPFGSKGASPAKSGSNGGGSPEEATREHDKR